MILMPSMEAILQMVGRLNYTWTNTESLLIYLIMALTGTSKDAAAVVFLTLNTSRARLDLIDRLSKLDSNSGTRDEVLQISASLKREGKLRNKFNHCIYSFDENGQLDSTQLMRIAEHGDDLRYGKVEPLDDRELQRIESSIAAIASVNRDIWAFIGRHGIKP
jgi:hypothetical protein